MSSLLHAGEPPPTALPTQGQVAAGVAQMFNGGSAQAPVLNINQSSQRAVINWGTFNVGAAATVNFNQPNAQAATLNRVQDANPSHIFGKVNAPGSVTFLNPQGVYFGRSAVLNVGAATASTLNQTNEDFMQGRAVFNRNGSTGEVVNKGELNAALGGYIALLAPRVRNEGIVVAKQGAVVMAGGEQVTLNFDASQKLASITTTPSQIATLIENKTAVQAPDGLIILSATALDALAGQVINSGHLNASSLTQKGGRILLEGGAVQLTGTSRIDATGKTGGGQVLVGMGKAVKVTMEAGAVIDASATDTGKGGTVVLRTDPLNPQSTNTVRGTVLANGGEGGAGGFIETTGYTLDILGARIQASASNVTSGSAGQWLLNHRTPLVTQDMANTMAYTLNTGTNVTQVTIGDMVWQSGVSLVKQAAGHAELSLETSYGGNIILNPDVLIQSKLGSLGLMLKADGHIDVKAGSSIVTNGGSVRYRAFGFLPMLPTRRSDEEPESEATPMDPLSPNRSQSPSQITMGGLIDASSAQGQGGLVTVEADHILLTASSAIMATGATGGGSVLLGGDWQGGANAERRVLANPNALYQATTVTMAQGAVIDASATDSGKGGTVVLWSDVHNPQSVTSAHGTILAKGGARGGDGGQIETSGHLLNVDGISVAANAAKGIGGEWLLDPYNITISGSSNNNFNTSGSAGTNTYNPTNDVSNINVGTITGALSGGTSVTITTGSSGSQLGDIIVNAAITSTLTNEVRLRLQAANSIIVNQNISATGSGKLNVELDADNDNGTRNGGGIVILAANISTNGGYLRFGGTISNGSTGGDLYVDGGGNAISVTTATGAVTVGGQLIVATTDAAGFTINSGGGNVTLAGSIDSGNIYTFVERSSGGSWLSAAQEAKGGTNGGAAVGDGYLISITSKLENSIAIYKASYRGAWIGAYRDPNSSSWFWVGGPEAGGTYAVNGASPLTTVTGANGTSFFTQGSGSTLNTAGENGNGSLTNTGVFANFGAGEPNGTGVSGENVGQFFGAVGLWNDLGQTTGYSTSTNTSPYAVLGYVRETNAAPSAVNINAGSGTVQMAGAVGVTKELSNLSITAGALSAGAIRTSSSLTLNNSGTGTAAAISGAGTLTKSGTGTLSLTASNTYSGATSVNAGTLQLTGSGSLGSGNYSAALTVSPTAVFTDASSAAQTLSDLRGGGTINLNAGTVTISGNQAFTGTLNTATSLTVSGGTNSANGGLGNASAINITGGTVSLSSTSNSFIGFSSSTAVTIGAGATLSAPGSSAFHLRAFTLSGGALSSGAIQVGTDAATFGTFMLNQGANVTENSTISALGVVPASGVTFDIASGKTLTVSGFLRSYLNNDSSIIKAGSGTMVMSGTNVYNGNTTVNAGILQLGSGGAIGTLGNVSTVTGLSSANYTGNISVGNGATLRVNNTARQIFSGTVSGAGALNKQATGSLLLTGNNAGFSGAIGVDAGTLGAYSNTALGTGGLTLAASTNLLIGRSVTQLANNFTLAGNATVDLDTAVEYLIVGGGGGGGAHVGGGGGGGGVLMGSSSQLIDGDFAVTVGAAGIGARHNGNPNNSDVRLATSGGNSSLAQLTAFGGGHGASWNWQTAANGGSGGGGAFGSGVVGGFGTGTPGQGFNGGTGGGLDSESYNNGYLTGGGGGAGQAGANHSTVSSPKKSGDGGVGLASSITGNQNYYGGGGGGGLHNESASVVGLGGLGGGGNGIEGTTTKAQSGVANTGGGGGGGGNPSNLTSEGGDGGSGLVIVRYLGGSAGSGGTITAGSGTAAGQTLHRFTTTGNNTLTLNALTPVLSGNITGAGNLTVDATGGTVALTGTNTYANTTISGGTLKVGNSGTTGTLGSGTVTNNAALVLDRTDAITVANAISGIGSLTKLQASTATLTGANSYGTTTISMGTLQIGAGGITGSLGSGAVTNNGTLRFNRTDDVTVANAISGATGTLVQDGSNTLTLTSNNTYGGTTTINGGTLVLQNDAPNPTGRTFAGTGGLRIQSNGASFTSAFSTSGWNFGSTLTGLTIGKTTNASAITLASASTVAGPVSVYGGSITVSQALTAAGNILLDADTGAFLTQNTSGVTVNAAVKTTGDNNITLLGRGGSGVTQSGNLGVSINQLVEAGGTGTIDITGYGGLSNNGTSSSNHGIAMDGANAWVKSSGGNVTLSGFGGGANSGSYSQGIALSNGARVSAGGTGTLDIAGTGGTNTAEGLRGVVFVSNSSAFTAGGALNITGRTGTNGSNNSDGVSIDASTTGSASTGNITIVGYAGGGTGSEAISLSGTNTLGAATHAGNTVLRGNTFALAGTTTVATTGQVTLESTGDSFAGTLSLSSSLVVGSNATGLTIGKATNTSGITIGGAQSVAGPITVTGGAVALNAGLTTSGATGDVSITTSGLTGSGGINLASGRGLTVTVTPSGFGTYSGAIAGTNATFTKAGTGALYLQGVSSYSGGTTLSGGYLELNTGGRIVGDVVNNADFGFNQNADLTFSGLISGAGSVIKYGANTLSFSANNTYSGTTTISAGILQVGIGGTTGALGSGNLSNSGTLSFNRSDDITVGGVLSGTGGLRQAGSGRLILTADNIYGGVTTISSGTLQIGAGGTTGSLGGGAVTNNAALRFNRSDAVTVANVISGAGEVLKDDNNTLTLTASNTYTGATAVNAGTLRLGNAAALGTAAGGTTVASGAVLDLNGQTVTAAEALTLNGAGISSGGALINSSATAASYAGLLTLGSASAIVGGTGTIELTNTGTISGSSFGLTLGGAQGGSVASVIGTGAGTLTKEGAGTWTLSGVNTYTGLTTVSGGTLRLGNASALGTAASGTTVSSGAALDLNGQTVTAAEALTLSGTGVNASGALYNTSATAATFGGPITLAADTTIKSGAADLSLNGAIAGPYALTLSNTGLVNLGSTVGSSASRLASMSVSGPVNLYGDIWTTGAQTYSGNVGVGNDIGLYSTTDGITIGGSVAGMLIPGTLLYEVSDPLRAGNAVQYSFNGASTYSGAINRISYRMQVSVNGTPYYAEVSFDPWANNLTAADLRIPDLNNQLVVQKIVQNMIVRSNMTATSVPSKSSGVITGSGFTGYLELWPWDYAPDASGTAGVPTSNNNLYDHNDSPTGGSRYGSFQVHNITTGSTQTVMAWNHPFTFDGNAPDVGLGNYVGSANVHPDWTFTSGNSLGTNDFRLQVRVNETNPSLILSGGAGAVNVTGATSGLRALTASSDAATSQLTGAISNSALQATTLTKEGTGTLVLSAANTYAGATTVSAGTLAVVNAASLGSTAAGTTVASGATLDLQGVTVGAEAVTANGGVLSASTGASSLSGAVSLGSGASIDVGGTSLTLSGALSGASGLTKTGAGTLNLTANNTYSGTTTINAGTLVLEHDAPDPTSKTFAGAGVLHIQPSSTSFTNTFNTTGWNFGTVLTGLRLGKSGNLTGVTVGSATSVAGPINIFGGAVNLSSGLTITDATTGAINITTSGLTGAGGMALADGRALTVTQSGTSSYSGVISGTGASFTKAGAGTLTLASAQSFTGSASVNAGTLTSGVANLLNDGTAVSVATGASWNLNGFSDTVGSIAGVGGIALGNATLTAGGSNDSTTFSGVISGTGGLTKGGAGTLTLSGANTFSGGTRVSAGTLKSGAAGVLHDSSAVTVEADASWVLDGYEETVGSIAGAGQIRLGSATLTAGGNNTSTTFSGVIADSGGVTKTGSGVLTLSGINTYEGSTLVSGGTLAVGHAFGLGTTDGGTSVASGAALDLLGVEVVGEALTLAGGTLKDASSSWTGAVSLTANSLFEVGSGDTLTISGVVSGGFGVTKLGTGTLVLAANNTYSGGSTISEGLAQVGHASALGTGAVTVSNAAALDLAGYSIANALTLTGIGAGTGVSSSGVLFNSASTAAGATGAITLSGNATFKNAGSLTLGAINGASALSLQNTGAVILNGAIGGTTALTSLTAAGPVTVGANVTTTSTQTYAGTVTLSGGARTLTGSIINTQSTLGGGVHALTITGAADIDGTYSDLSSLTVTGTTDLGGNVTTSGTQTYTGAVTVSGGDRTLTTSDSAVSFASTVNSELGQNRGLTLALGAGQATFGNIVGGTRALGAIGITGTLDLNANVAGAASFSVSGTTDLGGNITTTGAQTYSGAVTLSGADRTLTTANSALTFSSTVNSEVSQTRALQLALGTGQATFGGEVGATRALGALGITGTLDLNADVVSAASFSVSGAADLGANVTTSSTQTYSGAVTLSGGNRTLAGSIINTRSTLAGGGHALTISGDADIDGAYTGLSSLSISGTTDLGGNVTTSGAQTYTGAVTLSGADRTLTGSIINTRSTLAGGGNALTITGAADMDGAFSGLSSLSISGAADLGGNVTTSGAQTYSDAVTLSGGARTLAGSIINTRSTLAGGTNALTITGAADIDGAYTGLSSLEISGATDLGANVTTSGTQTYSDAVTLSGGARTLAGSIINTRSTLAGGANALTITGAADIDGAYSNLSSLTVSGTTDLGGNLTTSGAQTYAGAVTLSGADRTLTTSNDAISFVSTLNSEASFNRGLTLALGTGQATFGNTVGGTRALGAIGITGALDLNANVVGAASFSVTGAADMGGNVTTSGAQTYSGAVTVSAASTLSTTNSNVSFGSTASLSESLTVNTGTGAGDITFSGAIDGAKALSLIAGTGAITLSGTVGQTTRLGAVTLNSSGATTLAQSVQADSVTTNAGGTLLINGGSVHTNGAQTYGEAITLGANTTLTGTTINTQSTLAGGGHSLTVTGAADINGAYTGLSSLSISGAADLGANVSTTGTQTYLESVTLSGSDRTLATADSVISFASTVNSEAGQNRALTLALGTGQATFGNTVGGTRALGAIGITGALDLNANVAGAASFSVSGAADLGGNVTTTGTQTYSNAVTLSGADRTLTTTNSSVTFGNVVNSESGQNRALTLALGTGQATFGNTVGGTQALGAIGITGTLDLNAAVANAASLSVSGEADLGANVTTAGTQTYSGAVTLSGGARTLAGSTIHTLSTLAGGGNALAITGAADIDGAYTGLSSLSISGTTDLGGNVTSTGTQTYSNAVTLSGGDRTLTTSNNATTFANTVNSESGQNRALTMALGTGQATFGNTVGGTQALGAIGITGTLALNADVAAAASFSVSGAADLGGNVTTSGAQTYSGAVTLSGANRTLAGSIINTRSTLAGGGHALTISGAADINGAYTGLSSLTVTGTTELGGNVTTSGTQTYTGAVTVSGGDRTLTTSDSAVSFVSTVNSELAQNRGLTLALGTGQATFGNIVGGTRALGAIGITGTLDLNANVEGAASLSVSGAADLGANVTTTGAQIYSGVVTLSGGARTLAGSIINTRSTLAGGGNALTITGAADIDGAYTGLSSLSISGAADLSANITTNGTQTYLGAVTLSGTDRTLTGTLITTQSTLAGGGNALTISGAADIDGAYNNLSSLTVSGTTDLGASVSTSGTQTYSGAVTVSANSQLSGSGLSLAAVALESGGTGYALTLSNTDATSAISGVVSGAGSLAKTGAGTLTLSGVNTYAGTASVTGGTLKLGNANALGSAAAGSGTTVGTGASLDLNQLTVTEPVTLAGGRILNGVLAGNMALTADSAIEAAAGSSLTLSGVISGDFGLSIGGGGTVTLSGNNSFTGQTIVSAGTLKVGHANALGSAAGATAVATGGTLDLLNVAVISEALTLNGGTLKDATSSWGGAVTLGADSTIDIQSGDQLTIGGVISGAGRLTKVGAGDLVLSANNSYTGGTTIGAGVVKVSADLNLGAAPGAQTDNNLVLSGGVLHATSGFTLNAQRGLSVTGDSTFTTDASVSVNYAGVMAGTAGLTKSGSGTLVLSGANTHTGSLTVAQGTLQVGAGSSTGALDEASAIAIHAAGTLVFNRSNAHTVANTISGAGALQQSGSDVLTLSGNNSGFTGASHLAAGTLNVGHANALGTTSSTGTISFTGGTLQFSAANQNDYSARLASTASQPITIDTNGQSVTFASALAGTGASLTKLGTGTLTLGGANTYTGATAINAGTLEVTSTGTLADATDVSVASGATYAVASTDTVRSLNGAGAITLASGKTLSTGGTANDTISGVISGAGSLTKLGAGTLSLTGANTYTGDTTVSAGTLQLTGNLSELTDLILTGTSTWDLRAAQTVASLNMAAGSSITNGAGTSSLRVAGAATLANAVTTSGTQQYDGALTLAANATLTGSTIHTKGALAGGGNSLSIMGAADIDGDLTNLSSMTVNGSANIGANVTTTGTQTYSGAVTLSGGARTLTGTTINTQSTLNGGGNALTIAGAADIDGDYSNLASLSITGTANIGASVTTIGTQGYDGAVTLSGGDRTLTATNSGVSFADTVNSESGQNRGLTLALGTGQATFGNTVGGTQTLGAINITGALDLNANVAGAASLSVSRSADLGGNVSTTGTQTYSGAVTLSGGSRTLAGSIINTRSTLAGGGNALTIAGAADIDGAYSNLSSLTVSGTTDLGGNVTTSGTQTYSDAVTLSGADRTLTSTNEAVTFSSTVNSELAQNRALTLALGTGQATFGGVVGGSQALGAIGITGALDLNANMAGAASLSVYGAADLGGNVTTSGSQTYSGAVTLSGADRTLTTTNSNVSFGDTVNSELAQNRALTLALGTGQATFGNVVGGTQALGAIGITGTLDLNANMAGAASLSVSGVADLGGNVTTSGSQTYSGAVTLSGADRTLTTTNSAVTFGNVVNSESGQNRGLTLALGTGQASFGNTVGGTQALGAIGITGALDLNAAVAGATNLSVSGAADLGGNVTTTGTQTYSGAVTLSGGNRTLTGSTISTRSTLAGGANALTIAGAADIDGDYSNLSSLSVSGAADLGGNVTTSGAQTYSDAVTLSGGARTLTGSTIHTRSTLAGGANALTIAGAADIDGDYSNLSGLSVSGTTDLGGNVTSSGAQTYAGEVTLSGANRTLTTSNNAVTFSSTVNSESGENRGLTLALGTGQATFGNTVGGTRAVGALAITGALDLNATVAGAASLSVSGATDLGANVTTSGAQTYSGAVTLSGGARTLAGSTISNRSTLAGSGNALTITGAADIDGDYSGLSSLSISGTADVGANITTAGTQTYAGAVTLSGADATLTGTTINTRSTLNGGGNALTITGAADIDGAYTGLSRLTVSGATNLGANVTTSGAQTYSSAVTLSSNVTLQSGGPEIKFMGTVDGDVAGQRALSVSAGKVTFINSVGESAALASLATTSMPAGPVGETVMEANVGSVRTTGDQTYNNLTLLTDTKVSKGIGNAAVTVNTEDGSTKETFPLRLVSSAGALNFAGTVEGGAKAKTDMRSLVLNAATSVTFNDRVGFDAVSGNSGDILANYTRHYGIYRLDVTAPVVNILGNITAYEHINIRGDAFIGGHSNRAETRYVFSLDPAVNFFGKVDGYGLVDGTYSLDARAIGFDRSVIGSAPDSAAQPVINFAEDVGARRSLAALTTQVAVLENMGALRGSAADSIGGEASRNQASVSSAGSPQAGTIRFGGNVTTTGAQSHFANRFVVSGGGARGTEFNAASFDATIGSGGFTGADGGRPRIRFSTNPSGDVLRALQRAGVSITSLPDESPPEAVMAQKAREKHSTQTIEDALNGSTSALPVVEVGELSEDTCDRTPNNECKIPLPSRKQGSSGS